MAVLRMIGTLVTAVCIATLLAEVGALAGVAARGSLGQDRLVQLLAVAYDVDLHRLRSDLETRQRTRAHEQPSYDEVQQRRLNESLNLDLREIASDKGLADVGQLLQKLTVERTQYDKMKDDFDKQLEKLNQGAVDPKLLEVQRQLDSVDPKLAKDQLSRVLASPDIPRDKAMNFVVGVFKQMSQERRKKLLAEYRSPEELDQLHEILDNVLRGMPEVELIRTARDRLKRFAQGS